MSTLNKLFSDELKDVYNAEKQLIKALPKMAKKASTESLKEAFTEHLEETEGHVDRIEKIGKMLKLTLTGKKCKAMEGLIEEGKEILDEEEPGPVTDAALIGAAQRVEHYEMAAYGVLRAMAQALGHEDAAEILQETLDEEGAADKKLTEIAEEEVLSAALEEENGEEGDEEEEE